MTMVAIWTTKTSNDKAGLGAAANGSGEESDALKLCYRFIEHTVGGESRGRAESRRDERMREVCHEERRETIPTFGATPV